VMFIQPSFTYTLVLSATAMADKLGVEFAIIHRKRNGRSLSAPEHMEILVGDVKDKVCVNPSTAFVHSSCLFLFCI